MEKAEKVKQENVLVTVMLNADLAEGLNEMARARSVDPVRVLETLIDSYLSTTKLESQQSGTMLRRAAAGKGEQKLRRYSLRRPTVDMLNEAKTLGYSRSLIIERAIQAALQS